MYGSWPGNLWQDLRYAARTLRKNPGIVLVTTVTLALGIGANTAIFSVVNGVLLSPLPYADTERLVTISETHPEMTKLEASVPDFIDWRDESHSFQEMAAYTFQGYKELVLTRDGAPEQLRGTLASHNLFTLLGVRPALGRSFFPEEEQSGRDHVVILSHSLWQRRFGSAPNILGRAIEINGESYTVVGVMGSDEQFPLGSDVWLPLSRLSSEDLTNRKYHPVAVVARLNPGVTFSQARTEMEAIAGRLQQAYPATNKSIGVTLAPFREQFVDSLRAPLWILLGAVGMVLLIACSNVANLLLARAARRQREVAIRAALGASRGRLVQQFLTESVLLAFIGGGFGLLLAMWSVPLLRSSLLGIEAGRIPRMERIGVDLRVLGFTLAISVLTGILFGVVPALQASRTDLNDALKQEGRASAGSRHSQVGRLLVIVEVALAVVVLVSAGLLVRTFRQLTQAETGFRTDHLLTAQLSLPDLKYSKPEQVTNFYQQLFQKIEALPGVKGVAAINSIPLMPSHAQTRFAVEGVPLPGAGQYPVAQLRACSPGYFEMMGIQLKAGRLFSQTDLANTEQSSFIINETMARLYFPNQDAVGRNILLNVLSPHPTPVRIVGVVADVKDLGVDAAVEPELYYPDFSNHATLLIRTETDPLSLSAAVRHQVLAVDSEQPVFQIRSMEEILSTSLARRRFSTVLLTLFSVLALLLAGVGVYGLMAYSITQRTREIGVRMALGAQVSDILRLVLRQGFGPVLLGVACGILGALAVTRVMSGLLYGVSATDPLTFGIVCLVLMSTALLAIYIPARRASRIDPLEVLRSE